MPDQLRVYVLMIEKLTGIRPVAARLIYTRHVEFIDVDVSDEALEDTLARHQDAWKVYNKQLSKPGDGERPAYRHGVGLWPRGP